MPSRRRKAAAARTDIDEERSRVMRILSHSPKDLFAGSLAFAAVGAIVANALFMQAGHHPSPMFGSSIVVTPAPQANPLPKPRPAEADASEVKPAALPHTASSHSMRPPASIPSAAKDPVADLINSTRRIAAVQRALTDYGYGQLKPTGTVGTDTQAAIRKFEQARKMPVTGQMSDHLVRELSAMTGRSID
ncbi:MAG: peptidoglycan-binding domain-containing protein [Nitrobacter sp.]